MTKKNIQETQDMSSQNNVSIAGGKLILSLPDAQTPVVWQMSLDHAQSSSFTISEDKKNKVFALVSKAQDGNIDEIAVFGDRESAVDVLMKASGVLQDSSSGGSSVANQNSKGCDKSDKYGALIAFALIVVLFFIWMISASSSLDGVGGSGSEASSSGLSSSMSPRDSSGVPVSADDFLSNR